MNPIWSADVVEAMVGSRVECDVSKDALAQGGRGVAVGVLYWELLATLELAFPGQVIDERTILLAHCHSQIVPHDESRNLARIVLWWSPPDRDVDCILDGGVGDGMVAHLKDTITGVFVPVLDPVSEGPNFHERTYPGLLALPRRVHYSKDGRWHSTRRAWMMSP